jgi:predicted glycoside hydrolase/deacetylase ChbG (UPF0249 family)
MIASRSRRFTLCADDFGQAEAINLAIIELICAGRLGATSVMSQGPAWPEGARVLANHQHMADVGLHLNLTHHFEGSTVIRPLAFWMLAAPLGMIDVGAVRATFRMQIDEFVKHFGRLPDYIDGHQHVHAFPLIRELVTELIAEYWTEGAKPWVRAPDRLVDAGRMPLKGEVLKQITRGFSAHLERQGLRFPSQFAGLYSLTPGAGYPVLMKRWLQTLPSGTLMMCHPGLQSADRSDPIREARYEEYQYLSHRRLQDDCDSAGASLVRFADLRSDPPGPR